MATGQRCFPTKILTGLDIDRIRSMRESDAFIFFLCVYSVVSLFSVTEKSHLGQWNNS